MHANPMTLFVAAASALALVACDAPRTAPAPAPGTTAGALAPLAEAQARAGAGARLSCDKPGAARIVTRGEGPVVLHGGTPTGSAASPGVREPVPASGLTGSGCE